MVDEVGKDKIEWGRVIDRFANHSCEFASYTLLYRKPVERQHIDRTLSVFTVKTPQPQDEQECPQTVGLLAICSVFKKK